MNKFDLVVKGQIVLPDEVILGEVGVNKGKIQGISRGVQGTFSGDEVIDVDKSFVFPGMIDGHVHCFSNPNEGFIATTAAAAAGGITTIIDMPYDLPNPVNNVDQFQWKVNKLQDEVLVDTCLWGTIKKKGGIDQIEKLAEAGAVAFKMSTFETDEYRFPSISDSEIIKAFEELKKLDLVAAFHAENDELIVDLIAEYQDQGKVYPKAHMETRPPFSETTAVLKLMELAYWTKAKLHIVHVSHPRTIELVQQFKQNGTKVTTETCYPYLLLNCEDLEKIGPKAKNNPPLRYQEDVDGLWKHLDQQNIDFITSDHAPWAAEQKNVGNDNIFLSSSGMPGLDIMVPLMFDSAVKEHNFSPIYFAKLMAQNPADIYGIPNKGRIEVGYDADFTIIDPTASYVIDEATFHSNSKLSPFHGHQVTNKVTHTIIRGKMVYDGQDILVEPGFGKFVPGKAYKEQLEVSK